MVIICYVIGKTEMKIVFHIHGLHVQTIRRIAMKPMDKNEIRYTQKQNYQFMKSTTKTIGNFYSICSMYFNVVFY